MDVVSQKDRDQDLFHLSDVLVEDLMNLTDDELLAEVASEGLNAEAEAARLRASFAVTLVQTGKARLDRAKAAAAQERGSRPAGYQTPRVQNPDVVLGRFANDDAKLRSRLTMAARNGEGASERDMESALADLRELGAIDDEGNPV